MKQTISKKDALEIVCKHIETDGETATLLDAGKIFGEIKCLPNVCEKCEYRKAVEESIRIYELCKRIKKTPLPEGKVFE